MPFILALYIYIYNRLVLSSDSTYLFVRSYSFFPLLLLRVLLLSFLFFSQLSETNFSIILKYIIYTKKRLANNILIIFLACCCLYFISKYAYNTDRNDNDDNDNGLFFLFQETVKLTSVTNHFMNSKLGSIDGQFSIRINENFGMSQTAS